MSEGEGDQRTLSLCGTHTLEGKGPVSDIIVNVIINAVKVLSAV